MHDNLDKILEKSMYNQGLSDDDLACLLLHNDEVSRQKIFAASREVRRREFGSKVFLYGFVYFSTFCRNDCSFCYYRRSNKIPYRYRKTSREIIHTAKDLKDSGVHLIDLTMGEDDYYLENDEKLIDLVKELKTVHDIAVMVSPGVVSPDIIKQLAEAGADWYALYQETHNKKTFSELRLNQDYDVRMKAKTEASSCGMLIEEGLLSGIGESTEDIIKSLHIMKEMNVSQGRSMTFIPQHGTPMEHERQSDFLTELRLIAVLRLYLPDILIPASLDVDGIRGLRERLMAGANVVTSIIPPDKGFAGVANAYQDINEGFRTVPGIQNVLKECELSQASLEEYKEWMEKRKKWLKTNCEY
jgi:methylornithine synthase